MKYKTELHCHSSECCDCARDTADAVVESYIEKGYHTLVLTNHFKRYECERLGGYGRSVELLFEAYDLACRTAMGRINVILGVEIGLNVPRNDYLLFGVTREFLLEDTGLFDRSAEEVYLRARAEGMLFIQAHPLRRGCVMADGRHVDGYEAYNASSDVSSNRELLAEEWARVRSDAPVFTSGSDYHGRGDGVNGGIVTESPIANSEELMSVLRSGEYTLIGE